MLKRKTSLSSLVAVIVAWSLIFGIYLIFTPAHTVYAEEVTEKSAIKSEAKDSAARSSDVSAHSETTTQAVTEPSNENTITMQVSCTAYCSCHICCGKYAENRPKDANGNDIVYTASGARAESGKTVAVDPNVIPLGSTVIIDGVSYIAQDTGSAVKGNVVDIYMTDHRAACNFGRQEKTAVIILPE